VELVRLLYGILKPWTDFSQDLIELGLPFTDPIADGPTIQKANTQALKNGVTVTSTLEIVRVARKKGLRAPVLFMGYYNPLLSYGEDRMIKDAKEAGVNGFIVVDLPPEEAVRFRNFCTKGGYDTPVKSAYDLQLILNGSQNVLHPSDCTCHFGIPDEAALQDCRLLHIRCFKDGGHRCARNA